jgi:hypothetical protein
MLKRSGGDQGATPASCGPLGVVGDDVGDMVPEC